MSLGNALPSSLQESEMRPDQEAARNGIQHARPQRIELSLGHSPDGFTLRVWNDGALWVELAGSDLGLGLRIMRYRAGVLGGTLVIRPGSRGGTEVVCVVPSTNPGLGARPGA